MRRSIFASTLALTLLTAARPTFAQRDAAGDSVDAVVRSFLKEHTIPAAAVAVVRRGKVVKSAGYGTANLELDAPATAHSAFEIGSITKQFTAEAVMMLVEQRKLRLDDPLSQYVSGTPDAWRDIRLRHLLTHTSGLHDWESDTLLSFRREYTIPEFIALVARHPLDFAPGTKFSYSNSAHPLLGAVIERVAGVPYERFIAEHIFSPAGMTETRFRDNVQIVPHRASGYVDVRGTLVNGEPMRPSILHANGGIVSTAPDMARWLIALDAGALVSKASLARMLERTRMNDGSTFPGGIAWFLADVDGRRMAVHNGSTAAGFSSVVYRALDEELGVVVLFDIDRFDAVNKLATRILQLYR